jgi:hypothetical protein
MLLRPIVTGKRLHRLASVFLTLTTSALLSTPVLAQEGVQCPPEPTDMPVAYGDAVRCALEVAGDSDVFRFVGSVGETVVIRATRAGGSVVPCVRLLGPGIDQEACLGRPSNRLNVAIAGDGSHTISVRDLFNGNTGGYTLALERVRPPANASGIVYGQTLVDNLTIAGDSDLFSFSGSAGDLVRVSASRVGGSVVVPCIDLWTPMGVSGLPGPDVTGCVGAPSNHVELSLPQTGRNSILIRDLFDGNTGAFSVTVQCLSGLCTSPPPPPTAANDTYGATFDTPLVIAPPGVLANDNSNGGGAMTAVLNSATTNGSLSLDADGGFTYTPSPGFSGSDSFTYRAVNSAGQGNVATVTIVVASSTIPLAPSGLYVSSVVGNLVTLRWTILQGGVAPANFVLEGGLLPGEVIARLPTGSTAPIFSFVAPTGSFYLRLHALSGASRSGASNEIRIHVNVPVAPSAPAGLTGLVDGSTVALTWKQTFGGGAPTSLVLDVAGTFSTSLPLAPVDSVAFSGVPPGTYMVSLRAANGGGTSGASNAVMLTVPGPCTGAPGTPENFLLYRVGSTLFALWDPPTSGAAPTGYELQVTGAFVGSFPTTGRSLSGSTAPGSYSVSVRATNACGTSALTAVQTVIVP